MVNITKLRARSLGQELPISQFDGEDLVVTEEDKRNIVILVAAMNRAFDRFEKTLIRTGWCLFFAGFTSTTCHYSDSTRNPLNFSFKTQAGRSTDGCGQNSSCSSSVRTAWLSGYGELS